VCILQCLLRLDQGQLVCCQPRLQFFALSLLCQDVAGLNLIADMHMQR